MHPLPAKELARCRPITWRFYCGLCARNGSMTISVRPTPLLPAPPVRHSHTPHASGSTPPCAGMHTTHNAPTTYLRRCRLGTPAAVVTVITQGSQSLDALIHLYLLLIYRRRNMKRSKISTGPRACLMSRHPLLDCPGGAKRVAAYLAEAGRLIDVRSRCSSQLVQSPQVARYGNREKLGPNRLHLHSSRIAIPLPISRPDISLCIECQHEIGRPL
jgi:hypothetical protein